MAGIGFELQKLSIRGGLLAPFQAIGHGAIIAAGPWIFTILAIALISLITVKGMGLSALSDFRGIVIYAFALSLFLSAPVVIIATRMVSDAIYSRKFEIVATIFFAALAISATISASFTGFLYGVVFGLSPQTAFVGTLTCVIVSMIWVAHAFCSAVRDYNGVTISFIAGLVTALIGAVLATSQNMQAIGLIWTFNIGLCVTLFWLTSRIFITFSGPGSCPGKCLLAIFSSGQILLGHWPWSADIRAGNLD